MSSEFMMVLNSEQGLRAGDVCYRDTPWNRPPLDFDIGPCAGVGGKNTYHGASAWGSFFLYKKK